MSLRQEIHVHILVDVFQRRRAALHRAHRLEVHIGVLDRIDLCLERHAVARETVELGLVQLLLPERRLRRCCE